MPLPAAGSFAAVPPEAVGAPCRLDEAPRLAGPEPEVPELLPAAGDPCAGVGDGSCAAMSLEGAPAPRIDEAIVWTGTELLVWGGCANVGGEYRLVADGGRYDPEANRWRPIARRNAPSPRAKPLVLWTGSGLLVWGGEGHRDGALWDPETDRWRPLPGLTPLEAPVMPRARAAAVGGMVLLWPDRAHVAVPITEPGHLLDPTTGRMTPIATPPARHSFPAVGVGPDSILLWGGHGARPADVVREGALYDARRNAWRPVSSRGAPSARYAAVAFHHQGRFVVRGGHAGGAELMDDDGAVYDPRTDRWAPLDASVPAFRPVSDDGSRFVPFDYGAHYVLGPGFVDVPAMAGYAVVLRAPDPDGVPADLRLDSYGAAQAHVIGRMEGELWVATRDLTRTWRMPEAGAWSPVDDVLSPPSMQGRSWRVVWTGRRLLAWGGLRETASHTYDCSPPCPPGAPCMQRMCTRRDWGHHVDGLVYTPSP